MKKQKNLFTVILSLFLYFFPIIIYPSAHPIPDNLPMPSVADLFGNMTEEQIVQQIQEAQKIFESLTPEEMEEFAKIVDQTYANMTPQDRADIEGIANLVKPYFPEEDLNTKALVEEQPSPRKQLVEETINTNNIQSLIDNINQQLDEVLQKIQSSKTLVEEFSAQWASKISFENMKREIVALKQDRLAKKLTKKENQEEKDLVKKLEDFYKNLKSKNSAFYVEDLFGLPSQSKQQEIKQLKQTQDILAFFDDAIDNVMPIIEKFLRKWDPEALELAKEATERTKRAKAVAQDASVRRGSAPAIPSPEPTKKSQPTSSQGSSQYPSGAYDSYAPYGGSYGGYGSNYPSYDYSGSNYPSSGSGSSEKSNKDDAKKDDAKKKDEPKKDEKKEEKKKIFTPYDEAVDALEGYFEEFDQNIDNQMMQFIKGELTAYPSLPKGITQDDQKAWILSTGKYDKAGLKNYTTTNSKLFDKYMQNPLKAKNALTSIEKHIPNMTEDDLKKFTSHNQLKKIKDRLAKYQDEANTSYDEILKRYEAIKQQFDTDPSAAALSSEYSKVHNQFEQDLKKFKSTIGDAHDGALSVQKRAKRIMRKIKGEQERAKQQPA